MTKLVLKTFVQVLVILLAVPACGSKPDGDSQVSTNHTPSLVGKIWRWTALTGPEEKLDVPQPNRYTLEFMENGRYGVRADCNTGSGSYELDGNKLYLGPGPMTKAACGPDSLEARFAVLIGKVAGIKMDGEKLMLELGEGSGSMVFEPMPQISLVGTSWLVRGYNNGKGGVQSVAAGTRIDATFTEEGKIQGFAGCNNYNGTYEIDGGAISMGPVVSTRKMCISEDVMAQETAFLSALGTAAKWEIRGERLQLRRADGALALDLVSAVTGTVTYLMRKALDSKAIIYVTLQDISRQDVAAKVIGEQVIKAGGKQVPIPFEITFDPAAIDPRMTYAVRANVKLKGKLIMTSTQTYPVITRDAPRYDVEIKLDPVGS